MHGHLGVQAVAQQSAPGIEQRYAGLITGSLNTED
jgi:hypothetical protein